MTIAFNQDDELAKAIDIFNNSGWGRRVQGILDAALGTNNPFNSAALADTGTAAGNVPVIPEGGALDDSILKPATTSDAGVVRISESRTSEALSDGFPLVMLLSAIRPLLEVADGTINIGDFRIFNFAVQQAGGTQGVSAGNVLSNRRGFLVVGGSGIFEGANNVSNTIVDQSSGVVVRGNPPVRDQFLIFGGQREAAEGIDSVGFVIPRGYPTSRDTRVFPPSSWHQGGMYFNAFGSPPKETSSASPQTHPVTDRQLGTGDLAIFILDGSQDAISIFRRALSGLDFAPPQFSEFAFFIGL